MAIARLSTSLRLSLMTNSASLRELTFDWSARITSCNPPLWFMRSTRNSFPCAK